MNTQPLRSKIYIKWFNRIIIVTMVLIVAFVVFFSYYSIRNTSDVLTQLVIERRGSSAELAALLIKERLDGLKNIAISLASRPILISSLQAGRVDKAMDILKNVPSDFPFIDKVVIADTKGIILNSYPLTKELVGSDFSYRDWYKGVSVDWQPYVSEIYQRVASPSYNITTIAVPIHSNDGRVINILALHIKLDTFFDWTNEIFLDPASVIYVVDKNGSVVAHSKYPPQGRIIDYSSVLVVKKVLSGLKGVEITLNDVEKVTRLSAYASIKPYNWGVIIAQEKDVAFHDRNTQLLNSAIVYSVVILLVIFIGGLIFQLNRSRDRQQMESMLLAGILESSNDSIITVDIKGNVISYNKGAEKVFGYLENEIIGKYADIFFPPEERKLFTKSFEAFKQNPISRSVAGKRLKKDGSFVELEGYWYPVYDNSGHLVGVSSVSRDVTREHALERAKDEFLAIASHQMRTPLGSMRWNLEMLLKNEFGKIPELIKSRLNSVYETNRNLIALVNDLLNVVGIGQGRLIGRPKPVIFAGVMKDILAEVDNDILIRSIRMDLTGIPDSLPMLVIDPLRLHEILLNVIVNAITYSKPGGTVSISVKADKNAMIISVSDSGIGIPDEDKPKIFSRFYRASNAYKQNVEGTGLGLYVVKSYIEAWGGKVSFQSKLGEGTTMWLDIPLIVDTKNDKNNT